MTGAERVPLGLEGLDELLGGGVPKGSVLLVAGHPGAGKTTLGLKFIYHGASKLGERGVYVTVGEPRREIVKQASALGMDFKALEAEGKVEFVEVPVVADESMLETALSSILESVERMKASRLVLDNLSALSALLDAPRVRSFLHTSLIPVLKASGVTSLLVAELPLGREFVGHGVEEFVVDGIILLKTVRTWRTLERVMVVAKLKGVPTPSITIPYVIAPGDGIRPLLLPKKSHLERASRRPCRYKVGDEKLASILGDSMEAGTQIALTGTTGAGKSLLAARLAVSFALEGLKSLYVSFEEPEDVVLRRLEYVAGSSGEWQKRIRVTYVDPTMHSLTEIVSTLYEVFHDLNPDLVVLDGLGALERVVSRKLLYVAASRTVNTLRSMRICGVYVFEYDYPRERTPVDNLVDVLIVLKMREVGERMRRRLIVWKNRRAIVSHAPIECPWVLESMKST